MTEWTKEKLAEIRKHDASFIEVKKMADEIERLQKENQLAWNTAEAAETRANHAEAKIATLTRERDEARAQAETLFHQPVAQQNIDLQEQLALADKLAEALRAMWNASSDEAQLEGGRAVDACLKAWEQGRGK